VDAEAALLGALMIDNRLLDRVAEVIQDQREFFEPLHGRIYQAILELTARNMVATPVTLKPLFENDAAMKEVGGPSYLAQLTGSGAAIIGAVDFARQVNELARVRNLFAQIEEIKNGLSDDGVGPDEAFAIAAKVEAIAYEAGEKRNDKSSKTFSVGDSMDRVIERIALIKTSGQPIGATAPDIPELTDVVGPLERKHMHVWAGRPGMGKSASHAARRGRSPPTATASGSSASRWAISISAPASPPTSR
jgi:replicative DNA helicase